MGKKNKDKDEKKIGRNSDEVEMPVQVVASPVLRYDPNSTAVVAPEVKAFVDLLNSVEPKLARQSEDRIENVAHLNDALRAKRNNVKANGGTVLPIDFKDPLELLHFIDPGNPKRWVRIGGGAGFGGNVYKVLYQDGDESQSLIIQYAGPTPIGH